MLAYAVALALAAAPEGEKAVSSVLDTQIAAWNKGDLPGFCAVYADDASFVTPSGVTHGRAEVLARYQKRYPDKKAMGTLALKPLETRLKGETATVLAEWKLSYADKPEASGHTLLVLHLQGGAWRIVQDASM